MKLVLTFVIATLVWHHRDWHHEVKYWDFSGKKPAGYYTEITGPKNAGWLVRWLEWNQSLRKWEVLEPSGWVPLHDYDVLIEDADGSVRIQGL